MKTNTIGLQAGGFVNDSLTIHSGQSRFKLPSAAMAEVRTEQPEIREAAPRSVYGRSRHPFFSSAMPLHGTTQPDKHRKRIPDS
jgi:hypothetical protein